MHYELFLKINFLKVIRTKNGKKLLIIYFDSNNRILIPLSSFFSLQFDQMNGTWPIWSHYPIDPIIRDPIKRSLLYFINNSLIVISWLQKIDETVKNNKIAIEISIFVINFHRLMLSIKNFFNQNINSGKIKSNILHGLSMCSLLLPVYQVVF